MEFVEPGVIAGRVAAFIAFEQITQICRGGHVRAPGLIAEAIVQRVVETDGYTGHRQDPVQPSAA
jgi:hypothetical protein